MSDRHKKWVRVEPGTVIPAGQPYRVEYDTGGANETSGNTTLDFVVPRGTYKHFVDSSWKPPMIEVPRAAYDDLVNGVQAMGDRPPTSRAEWMARDLVKAVEGL